MRTWLPRLRPGWLVIGWLCVTSNAARADIVATFDDLPSPPPLTSSTGLQFANNNSLMYDGATWDSRFSVVGDQYAVSPPTPLFGIPHSGHYYVTNGNGDSGLTIATTMVLTGASFGRNEYYGFGGGADQVTIVAVSGSTDLLAVPFDLPETHPGQPEPLSFVDTSAFGSLTGITGYRIDRRTPAGQPFSVNWVGDDFHFRPVPEPGSLLLILTATPGIATWWWRKRGIGSRRGFDPVRT